MSKINWRDHLIQLIMVIIGITIALRLNNWGEQQKNSELREKYIASLITGLEHDVAMLDTLILTNEQFSSYYEKLRNISTSREAANDSVNIYFSAF